MEESKSCILQTPPSQEEPIVPIFSDYENRTDVEYDNRYTEGGIRAWSVVFGVALKIVYSSGILDSWGVFQAYYEQKLLRDVVPGDIAWIGSIQRNIALILSAFAGWLLDLGYCRIMLHTSNILAVIATLLTAQCRQYWQFLLCQGILTGAKTTLMLIAFPVASQWFKHHRELAFGLMLNGSALGGIIFPSVLKALFPSIGFQWSMRVMALLIFFMLSISSLLVKERIVRHRSAPGGWRNGKRLSLAVFKNNCYSIYCIACIFFALGALTLNTYMAASAEKIGVPQALAFYLVATTNAGILIGNTVLGPLADCIGPLNVLISSVTVFAVVLFAWPFARTIPTLFTVAALSG
ncbi:major facilitator superfamily domain-containing protein [Lentinula raphanica]|nr:major facilitator superfamily domain-containing protein [Lentinula raphanica]